MTVVSAEKGTHGSDAPAEVDARPASGRPDASAFVHLRGREAVLGREPELRELAARCGQEGAVHHLRYLLDDPYFGSKVPHLLLLHGADGSARAAVLLHEYRALGMHTGFYRPLDSGGDHTVLAPPEERGATAWAAAQFLLRHGAWLAILSVGGFDFSLDAPVQGGKGMVATQSRVLHRTLPLEGTYDATLAQFGAHSRRNLRHARRRAVAQLGATFHPAAEISEADFLSLNRSCAYKVPDWVARRRYQSVSTREDGIFAGMQAADGQWLSVAGGRRYEHTTSVDWQMNRRDLSSLSIGTAFRSFLLESEIEQGTKFLHFEGGTPHSIRSAFLQERVGDLLVARPPLSPRLLRLLPRLVPKESLLRLLPKGSLLADVLRSPGLQWRV